MDMLGLQISRFFDHESCVDIYADFTRQEAYQADSEAHRFTRELLRQYPYVTLHNAASRISSLRLIKEDAEIDDLKQAIDTAGNSSHDGSCMQRYDGKPGGGMV